MSDRPDRLSLDDLADEPPSGHDENEGSTPRRDRRLLMWLVLIVALVIGGLYLAGYAFAGDRLPRDTGVAGVDVGGMRPAAAQRAVAAELDAPMGQPITLVVGRERFEVDPEEVGLDVDIPASVGQVPVGRSWNPADMWETVVGGEEYDAVVVAVDGLLEERLAEVAAEVGEEPREGQVRLTRNGARPTYPRAGTRLDVDAAAEDVLAAYPLTEEVRLELSPREPKVSRAEVNRAMREFANPAMSAPVTFVLAGKDIVLRPTRYAPALSMKATKGTLRPRVDRRRLLATVHPAVRRLSQSPREATVRIENGRPRLVPGRPGVIVDASTLQKRFLRLAAAEEGKRRGRLPVDRRAPDVTTAEARAWGITEKVSEFTTYYPHAEYRNVNIGRAAQIVDGTILEPGETFSLNGTVGERTAANGFTKGFIISNGVFKEDYGGGVSQIATTLFNAAFFAGLEDVEHKPHSFYIDRYPVGREATVAWPSVDLRFRNDTDHGVLIDTQLAPSSWSSRGAITVRMWSTKVWDIESRTGDRYATTPPDTRRLTGEDCVPHTGYAGFQIDVTRVFRRPGAAKVHHTENFHTVYTPSDTVICG